MAKLTYVHGTMTSGKTTELLQEAYNFRQIGQTPYLLTATIDTRSGKGKIKSRIGIEADAETFKPGEDLFVKIKEAHRAQRLKVVMVDECQFLSKDQVWQLSDVVDELGIRVVCYGLKSDFKAELFEGSAALLALADEITERTGTCRCGEKATMVARIDGKGHAIIDGPQVQVGGEESYAAMSRKEWKRAVRLSQAVEATRSDGRGLRVI
jgi:thymidine kinase